MRSINAIIKDNNISIEEFLMLADIFESDAAEIPIIIDLSLPINQYIKKYLADVQGAIDKIRKAIKDNKIIEPMKIKNIIKDLSFIG